MAPAAAMEPTNLRIGHRESQSLWSRAVGDVRDATLRPLEAAPEMLLTWKERNRLHYRKFEEMKIVKQELTMEKKQQERVQLRLRQEHVDDLVNPRAIPSDSGHPSTPLRTRKGRGSGNTGARARRNAGQPGALHNPRARAAGAPAAHPAARDAVVSVGVAAPATLSREPGAAHEDAAALHKPHVTSRQPSQRQGRQIPCFIGGKEHMLNLSNVSNAETLLDEIRVVFGEEALLGTTLVYKDETEAYMAVTEDTPWEYFRASAVQLSAFSADVDEMELV